MEGPDYDAIEQRLRDWEPYLGRDEHWSSGSITLLLSDQEKLLKRCRELEAENRRLRKENRALNGDLFSEEARGA